MNNNHIFIAGALAFKQIRDILLTNKPDSEVAAIENYALYHCDINGKKNPLPKIKYKDGQVTKGIMINASNSDIAKIIALEGQYSKLNKSKIHTKSGVVDGQIFVCKEDVSLSEIRDFDSQEFIIFDFKNACLMAEESLNKSIDRSLENDR